MSDSIQVPDFDKLPKVEDKPQGCAWGVFDKDGKQDVYGTLNFLTPSVVKAAAAEVSEGHSISLNWPIGSIKAPGFGRKGLVHKVISWTDHPTPFHGYDDEVEFNTQCSSQWDSLCHFHYQPTQQAYNGIRTTIKELTQGFGEEDNEGKLPTLNHWHKKGCMITRGVFIDYRKHLEENGKSIDCFSDHVIHLADIQKIAKEKGIQFRQGDVLIVRSGFTEELSSMDAGGQEKALGKHKACGIEGTEETAKWFWDQRFTGVAGDMIALEHVPAKLKDGSPGGLGDLVLHGYMLGLFGMYIGELWDLKALSEHCAKTGRYTFMLSSAPLNVPGSIGSPPNALAVF